MLLCFDEQTPKLIHENNILRELASGTIQSRLSEMQKSLRNRKKA